MKNVDIESFHSTSGQPVGWASLPFTDRVILVVMPRILVPRLIDASNLNAQCLNTKELLSRWTPKVEVNSLYYNPPDNRVANKEHIYASKLWPWRFWSISVFLHYQASVNGVFYAQADIPEVIGIRLRDFFGRKVPVIITCEGLMGDEVQEEEYSQWAGHPVFCQRAKIKRDLKRNDWLFKRADQIIAISPFLAKLTRMKYGDKVSVLPLGIDGSIFYPPVDREEIKLTVVSVGHVAPHKRPDIFLQLAIRHPDVEFRWYGDGESRQCLISEAAQKGTKNLYFPGTLPAVELAEAFRAAHIFVMPSKAEGAPKVSQEATACGLPAVLFGFYEAPSVVHEKNGFVVWSDEEFFDRVGQLIDDEKLRREMAAEGAAIARKLDWDLVAPMWEAKILHLIESANSV